MVTRDKATRDNYALLIAGSERRFMNDIMAWNDYLVEQAGFAPDKVINLLVNGDLSIRFNYVEAFLYGLKLRDQLRTQIEHTSVLEQVDDFFRDLRRKTSRQPAVLIYSEHGDKGSFSPGYSDLMNENQGKNASLSYKDLAQACSYPGGFLFINDCCFSGSVIPIFEEQGILPEQAGVITSANSNEISHGNIFQQALLSSLGRRFLDREIIGNKKVIGKINLRPLPSLSDDLITDFELLEEFVKFEKPLIQGPIQHPQRCGLDLGHLLFPR